MAGYGWTAYDVRKGGIQFINDTGNRLDLVTEFAKMSSDDRNGNWGLRVKGFPRADANDHPKTTLIFYLGTETPGSSLNCSNESELTSPSDDVVCGGTMAGLHGFKVILPERRADRQASHRTSVTSLRVPADTIWQAKSTLTDQLKNSDTVGMIANNPGQGNLHFVQKAFEGSFDLEVLFSSESSSETMTSSALTEATQDALSTFRERFHSVYLPQAPFEDEHHIKFSQSLISNLMGGIGYFDGTSKVDVSSAPEYAEMDQNFWEKASSAQSRASIEEQGPYQLFSMVPSRPFFPRGFLWDEGFHLQVIMEWDIDLALDIVSSWFNLMDDTGWIAREQILGPEARTKVPPEFQTQYTHYANPPTLFLVVESFLAKLDKEFPYFGAPSQHLETPERGRDFLRAIYPKLKKHYEWFRRTQAGNLKVYQLVDSAFSQGYRWRGRTPQHTLTSGLDDYPRALPPHPEELHVDALCWVGSMAVTLKKISDLLSEQEDQEEFSKDKNDIIRSIDGIHWSESHQAYCDATVVEENRVEKVCHKGYISLFPFLVNLMGPDNPRLGAVLDLVRDPEQLWSPHGVRSLSAQDEYYGTDENYWRSPIWININYMVIQRLLVSTNPCTLPSSYSSASKLIHGLGTRSRNRPLSPESTRDIRRASAQSRKHSLRILEGDRLCMGAIQFRHRQRPENPTFHWLDFTDCAHYGNA